MTISELLSRFSIPADRKGRTNLILEIFLTGFAATLFLPLGEIRGTCMWGGFLVWLLVAEKNYLGKLARDRSFLLLLGLIGYALLSATWSPDPKGSFKSWKTTFDDYLCVIPVLVHFAYQPDFRARLMRIFSMAGLFSVFADCAQYAYEFASGAYREIDMRMAHYRRPLPLVLYAPFLLARAHETSGRQRVLWGASFVIAGLLLLPTGARGAWLAFATATSLYFAFFLSFRQLLLIPVACAAILGGAYAVLPDDSIVVTKINEGFSTSSVRCFPVRPDADLDDQRHLQFIHCHLPISRGRWVRISHQFVVRHFQHQFVMHLQHERDFSADFSSQFCTAIIASLIRSAAVPCIGALIAARSAPWRRLPLLERISGNHRRRPKAVST
jgi:hypothetical protein